MASTIYIDESGDTGITKLRSPDNPGSSEYFAMGAVVLQPAGEIRVRKLLDQLQSDFKKTKRWKHATNLNHIQKVHFCKQLASEHCRFFGLISYKPSLGEYADEISWEPDKFYNKCAKYLLELICAYLSNQHVSLHDPTVVFEERNHDYDAMIRYIERVKNNPIYSQSKSLKIINPFAITKRKKEDEDLLRIADMVAHAVYSCVNLTPENFGIPETRYIQELAPKFGVNSRGVVAGHGLKFIHSIDDLNLLNEVQKDLESLRGSLSR